MTIEKENTLHIMRNFGYNKTLRKMIAAIAHTGTKIHSYKRLLLFEQNPSHFASVQKYICHYTPETKQQPRQWTRERRANIY